MAVQFAFAKIVTEGLALAVDAADPTSYSGTGTTWRDITPNNNSGTISGSVTYTTAYKGGFIFSGPTASIAFPSSSANFGSGSFTVEMAFSPSSISGIHWLASKNSGSFPSWGIYLSGSNNSGKLFSEFRISSAVSTSISSSTTFITGSVYQVDVRILPASSASGFYIDGVSIGGGTGSAAGSLTNTGSLFLGNSAPSSSQAFLGSIYATKIYLNSTVEQPPRNFNAIAPRFSKPLITDTTKKQYDILVVAGGGSGGTGTSGGPNGYGGGAGGLQYVSNFAFSPGKLTIIVGKGGTVTTNGNPGVNGDNSVLGSITSIGGGAGKGYSGTAGNGGSGGGAGDGVTTGLGTLGQGNNGSTSGGGGGAGTAGSGLNGGSGSFISAFTAIGGSPSGWFAGGGGGATYGTLGSGGAFGGGGSGVYTASAATPVNNSGASGSGGGGGATTANTGGTVYGSTGGSGIVAIRYNGTPIALGGEITQSAGYTYHVFRTTGTSSFTIF